MRRGKKGHRKEKERATKKVNQIVNKYTSKTATRLRAKLANQGDEKEKEKYIYDNCIDYMVTYDEIRKNNLLYNRKPRN